MSCRAVWRLPAPLFRASQGQTDSQGSAFYKAGSTGTLGYSASTSGRPAGTLCFSVSTSGPLTTDTEGIMEAKGSRILGKVADLVQRENLISDKYVTRHGGREERRG